MTVIGLGEKKTPEPFIVACDKFIYLEILRKESENQEEQKGGKNARPQVDKINPKLINLIAATVGDLADDEGWAFMGDVGNLLQKKQPNFDARNYGYQKLTPLISAIERFEVEQRENQKGKFKLIFVRDKIG
jgi:uncharacterized LabA/DUF88 family protein